MYWACLTEDCSSAAIVYAAEAPEGWAECYPYASEDEAQECIDAAREARDDDEEIW